MANISTAHGSYTFNFANVKANNEKKVAWIKEFAKLTSEPYYETYFYDAESLTSVSVEGDEITLPFVGSGHWSYRNNIYWFEGGGAELKEIRQIEVEQGSVAAIDLGLDGFVTFLDNQGYQPFIINGKGAKSYNQFYNKRKANLQSLLMLVDSINGIWNVRRCRHDLPRRDSNLLRHRASLYICVYID